MKKLSLMLAIAGLVSVTTISRAQTGAQTQPKQPEEKAKVSTAKTEQKNASTATETPVITGKTNKQLHKAKNMRVVKSSAIKPEPKIEEKK